MNGYLYDLIHYDLTDLPVSMMRFINSFTFKIVFLAIIYYSSVILLLQYIFRLNNGLMLIIWVASMLVNAALFSSFPGLFYLDKPDDAPSVLIVISLGPISFPKALVSFLALVWSINSRNMHKHNMWVGPGPQRVTYLEILRKPVSKWEVNDPWINSIKRNADIGVPSYAEKCIRKWTLIKKIARHKIIL